MTGLNYSTQNRFKSYVFWIGIVSILMLIMSNYGLYDAIGMTSEIFKTLVNLVFATLASIGVLNNPTDKVNW